MQEMSKLHAVFFIRDVGFFCLVVSLNFLEIQLVLSLLPSLNLTH